MLGDTAVDGVSMKWSGVNRCKGGVQFGTESAGVGKGTERREKGPHTGEERRNDTDWISKERG